MADNIQEFQSPEQKSDFPVPERPVVPETKARLITEAMHQFNQVAEGINQLKRTDGNFYQDTSQATSQVARIASEGRTNEMGYRQVNEAADELRGSVMSKLRALDQMSQSLGGNLNTRGHELHEILERAASEPDPIKAFSIAEQASAMFKDLIKRVETDRIQQSRDRESLRGQIQDNAEGAKRLVYRISEQVGRELDDRYVAYQYARGSIHLDRVIEEATHDLSARERSILHRNLGSQDEFVKIVKAIIKPEDVTSPPAKETSPS